MILSIENRKVRHLATGRRLSETNKLSLPQAECPGLSAWNENLTRGAFGQIALLRLSLLWPANCSEWLGQNGSGITRREQPGDQLTASSGGDIVAPVRNQERHTW